MQNWSRPAARLPALSQGQWCRCHAAEAPSSPAYDAATQTASPPPPARHPTGCMCTCAGNVCLGLACGWECPSGRILGGVQCLCGLSTCCAFNCGRRFGPGLCKRYCLRVHSCLSVHVPARVFLCIGVSVLIGTTTPAHTASHVMWAGHTALPHSLGLTRFHLTSSVITV